MNILFLGLPLGGPIALEAVIALVIPVGLASSGHCVG